MTIRHRIDADRQLVRLVVTGTFTVGEMLKAVQGVLQDPGFRAGFDLLSDHTGVERYITMSQATRLVSCLTHHASQLKNMKWAVVTSAPASYGMMRALAVHLESIPIRMMVFSTEDEALRWLRP